MSKRASPAKLDAQRRDTELIALINDEISYIKSEYSTYFRKCKLWYDLYRGIYTQQYHGFRNSISIPFLYSVVQSDVARKIQMTFGQFPYINFEGFSTEDQGIARKNDLLIGVQMEDMDIYRKAYDAFMCLDLYGVLITKDGWRQDKRLEKLRHPTYEGGKMGVSEQDHWCTYFDGPDMRVIDPLDFLPDVGYRYIEDMPAVREIYYRELDDMYDQVTAEEAEGLDPFVDRAALDEVKRGGGYPMVENSLAERQAYGRNAAAVNNRLKYQKPVQIVERWGLVPADFAPDGQRHRKILLLNEKVIGKNIPMPYLHGQKPYSSASIGDPHFFHGVGKTELLSKLQAASNRIMNHKLDTLDLSISPAIIAGAGTGLDSSRPLHMAPGKILQLDTATVGDDVFKPYAPSLQGIQAAAVEIQTLWSYMQQGSGIIEDTISGGSSNVEQTAHEFAGRQAAVMTRLTMESHLCEKGWLEPTADRMRAMNRQYLTLPKQLRMIGSMAIRDAYGADISEGIAMDYEDLWPDYKARAIGATQNLLHVNSKQDVSQFIQMAGSNPMLMQSINWGAFAREILPIFGVRNVDKVLNEMQPGVADQVQQLLGGGGGPGGAPGQIPSTASGPGPLASLGQIGIGGQG